MHNCLSHFILRYWIAIADCEITMNSKPINAMIMGKSQSGKSSWINSFANYLYFLSLNHAIEAFKVSKFNIIRFPPSLTDYKYAIFNPRVDNWQVPFLLLGRASDTLLDEISNFFACRHRKN